MSDDWKKVEKSEIWNKSIDKKFVLKVGDELIGTFVGSEEFTYNNNSWTVYTFKQEDGDEIGVKATTILKPKLAKIKKGEMVKIVYIGDKQGKNKMNNPYHDYEVYHKEIVPVINENDGIGVSEEEEPFETFEAEEEQP